MPRLNDIDLKTFHLAGSHYGYSATPVDALSATEYTLAVLAVDGSGSTWNFRPQLQKAVKDAVLGCKPPLNPRGDNLMVRVVEFDTTIREEHGFKPVANLDPGAYDHFMKKSGGTALYDCAENVVGSLVDYGKKLTDQDYQVNALAAFLTDGQDLDSKFGPGEVKKRVEQARTGEQVESIRLILIGLNPNRDPDLDRYLRKFADEAGFDQYVNLEDLSDAKFAKLGGFISQSISAQSSSLGKGPSKPLDSSALTI